MKKVILIFLTILFVFPDTSYAAQTISMDDPHNTYIRGPYRDGDATRYEFKPNIFRHSKYEFFYDEQLTRRGYLQEDTHPAGTYWNKISFYCVGYYKQTFTNSSGTIKMTLVAKIDEGDANHTLCTVPPDPGPGDGDEGGGCGDSCAIFNCPGWQDYMGRLDDIKNAIPEPPDWHEVSEIFSDAIVPRLVDETRDMLDDLLGKAPEPPPTLPDLPELDDHQFEQKKPEMQDVPGLDGFDEKDVKDGAPVIQFEDDPTGGFDLSVDPMDNLPDVVPGGDPGAYKRDPKDPQNDFPGAPADKSIDMGGAPKPSDSTATPPVPGGGVGAPPVPGGGIGTPPNPGGNIGSPGNYKPNP